MIAEAKFASYLNKLEHLFFCERTAGFASGSGYIDQSTLRAWRCEPKQAGWIKHRMVVAFEHLGKSLEAFLKANPAPDRDRFDAFHDGLVKELYEFLSSTRQRPVVHPSVEGNFHGYAYNVYAKVVDLAYTHWCFRPPHSSNSAVRYPPSEFPALRHVLHVPLDGKVVAELHGLWDKGTLPQPQFSTPPRGGGMGSIRSRDQYNDLQSYFRANSDPIRSTNFPGHSVSPLAFDGLWGK